jgi:hypothetical protein
MLARASGYSLLFEQGDIVGDSVLRASKGGIVVIRADKEMGFPMIQGDEEIEEI